MTFGVNGQFSVGLTVNGQEVPLQSSGYNSLYIFNNTKDILPSAKVSIQDLDGALFDRTPVGSGTPFVVTLGGGRGGAQTVDFKTYGVPAIERSGNHVTYEINGIMDRAKYMQDRPKQAWSKKNSHEVIGAIASMCGLRPRLGSGFKDKMTWFAGPNQTFAQFSHAVADRGYAGAKSITALSVLDTNELRYVDMAQTISSGPSAVFQQGYADGELIIGYKVQDKMGFANAKMNHGMRMSQEGLDGLAQKFTEFAVPLLSGSLDMNGAEKKIMDHVRNEYAAPDVGNCQTGDTLVPTEFGLLRLDEMADPANGKTQALDLLMGSLGAPQRATTWYYSGRKRVLRVRAETGHTINGTYRHPNLTFDPVTAELVWVESKRCAIGDLLCINPVQSRRTTPLVLELSDPPVYPNATWRAIKKPTVMTTDLAQLLAYVVAEGGVSNHGFSFYNQSEKICARFNQVLLDSFGFSVPVHKTKGANLLRSGSRPAGAYLQQLGCLPSAGDHEVHPAYLKQVPWSILQADERSQLAFLAAYLEGDGSIDNKTGRLVWYTASEVLAKQMQTMLTAFGVFPSCRVGDNGHQGGTLWRVQLGGSDSAILWPRLAPFMVTKALTSKKRVHKSYGVPNLFWKNLLRARRKPGSGIGSTRAIYFDDSGKEVSPKWNWPDDQRLLGASSFLYENFDNGALDSVVAAIKLVSENAYAKLMALVERRYFFTPVQSILDTGYQHVYDLTMENGAEPAFIANGVLVHNTHEKYKQAEYQNRRGRLTFGLIVEVLLNHPVGAHVFDLVEFRVRNPSTGKPSVYNGRYIVTAKTRFVKGSYYYEKLELSSQGISGDGGGQFLLPTSLQDAVGAVAGAVGAAFQGFRL